MGRGAIWKVAGDGGRERENDGSLGEFVYWIYVILLYVDCMLLSPCISEGIVIIESCTWCTIESPSFANVSLTSYYTIQSNRRTK